MSTGLGGSSGQPERTAGLLFPLGLLVAVVTVYSVTLYFPFHFDDDLFLRDDNVRLGRATPFLVPPSPRYLVWLTFLLQYQLHGPNPSYFHAFNVLLHAVNAVTVFVLLLLVLRSRLVSDSPWMSSGRLQPFDRYAAFFGALVFALHPVQSEAVVYVYQRSTLMGSLFAFLTLWSHMAGRKRLTLFFFLLAVSSKEFTLVVPVLLWVWDGLRTASWRPSRFLRGMVLLSSAVATVELFGTYLKGFSLGEFARESVSYAGTQVQVFWEYLKLIGLFGRQNLDHQLSPTGLMRPDWWVSLFGILSLIGLLFYLRRRAPAVTFFGAFFGTFLLPTSSLLPSEDLMFEHRLYPSLAAFSGCFALALVAVASRRDLRGLQNVVAVLARVLPLLLIAFLCRHTVARVNVWRSNATLWEDAVSKSPGKFRPNYNLGVVLIESSPKEAIEYLRTAIAIDSESTRAYKALGEAYLKMRDLSKARRIWELALARDSGDPETYLELGYLHMIESDFMGADRLLSRARQLDPRNLEAYRRQALLHFRFGYLDKAVQLCEEGLTIDGNEWRLRMLLADVVAQRRNYPRAAELYSQVLKKYDGSELYYKLARIYWAMGQRQEADNLVRTGLRRARSPEMAFLGRSLLRYYESGTGRHGVPAASNGGQAQSGYNGE